MARLCEAFHIWHSHPTHSYFLSHLYPVSRPSPHCPAEGPMNTFYFRVTLISCAGFPCLPFHGESSHASRSGPNACLLQALYHAMGPKYWLELFGYFSCILSAQEQGQALVLCSVYCITLRSLTNIC